jgi:arginase family enzyme
MGGRPPPAGPRRNPKRGVARGAAQIRQRISTEAARIMAEEGVQNFHAAKRKAAGRLGLPETKHLPSNQEIEQALSEHLRLFHAQDLPATLRALRDLALEAMRFFEAFDPRLVGPVLSGNVTPYSEIQLHVTADNPEDIGFLLQEHRIPYDEADRRLRFGGDRHATLPAYRFLADTTPVELTVFSREAVRELPLSPVDGRPMRRASRKELEGIITVQAVVP